MNLAYLLNVSADGNHNKFYRMIPNIPQPGQFTAEYGRVGATPQKKIYSLDMWYKIYDSKLAKQYVDQSHLHQDVVSIISDNGYSPIDDKLVNNLVLQLQAYADKKISSNYKITSKEVTSAMIDSANALIQELSSCKNINSFNQTLIQLFTVIPRKMSNVNDFIAFTSADYADIVNNEQDLLDIMKAKVNQKSIITSAPINTTSSNRTILDILGICIRRCTNSELDEIKKHLGTSADKLKNAFYIVNTKTEKTFNQYVKENCLSRKNIQMYYHGSKNENYWGIITQGLKLKTNAAITGKMFGYGIYFASLAQKSINYTSIHGSYWAKGTSSTGYLAVYKVASKKSYDVFNWDSKYLNFHFSDVNSSGYDSLYAHKGHSLMNDEFIVYKENQATIRYLLELM